MYRIVLIFLILVFAYPASATPFKPRTIVSEVAEKIEENFYDAGRAKIIGDELRQKARESFFDEYKSALSLASALTDHIKPHDKHFRVTLLEDKDGKSTRLYGFADRVRRSGYGIKSASILPANIGYIEMTFFAHIDFEDNTDPAKNAIDAALNLIDTTDALIIDLSRNGGGSPHMVGYLASAFSAPDAEIYNDFKTRSESFSERPDRPYRNPILSKPVYILISARTASAAEALAYTLQASGRATVIGEPSYGAANPGKEYEVGNGLTVFIANGSPINPITKTNWEGTGVTPSIAVPVAEALKTAHLEALNSILETIEPPYRQDIQWVKEALEAKETSLSEGAIAEYSGKYGAYVVQRSENSIEIFRDRQTPDQLGHIETDIFYKRSDLQSRYRFVRGEKSDVVALEFLFSDGSISRIERD